MPSFSISNITQTSATVTITPSGSYVWYRLFVRKDGETSVLAQAPQYYLTKEKECDIAKEIAELEPGTKYWVNIAYNTTLDDATWQYDTADDFTTATEYVTYLVYDANGGTEAPETGEFTSDTNTTTVTVTEDEPTRDNYIFVGWNTRADGTGVDYEPGETKENIPATESGYTVTLYAQWADAYVTYIEYNANGGSGAPSKQTFRGTTATNDITVSTKTPTRSDYTFVKWNTQKDGNGVDYMPGETKKNVDAKLESKGGYTVTLYAIWRSESSGGLVWINGNWYQPYIYSGKKWLPAEAHVYDGGWEITTES